jgi:hypothetical protein
MKTHSERYQDLDEKIQRYKRIILIEMGLVSNNTIDTDGWKFVGFARRKSRRLWLNIDDVISMCNGTFGEHKVACVIVDVEEAESPEEQLIMHRSLDGLIGVHGAQLTQGVLLPTHGYILELLPWIPSYTREVGRPQQGPLRPWAKYFITQISTIMCIPSAERVRLYVYM